MASSIVQMNATEDRQSEMLEPETVLGLDLRYILGIIRRNIRWIAAICCGALVVGLLVTMFIMPNYTAVSAVMVEDEGEQIIEGSDLSPTVNGSDTDRHLQTQMDVLRSRQLAELVVKNGKFSSDEDFYAAMGESLPDRSALSGKDATPAGFAAYKKEVAAGLLLEALNVSMPAESRVISIQIISKNPNYSAKIANLYAEAFIANNLERKFDSSAYARKYLSEQLEEARSKLETSELDLNRYSRAAGLVRLQGTDGDSSNSDLALSITNSALINLNNQASAATADRISAEQTWQAVANQPVLNIPNVLSNPAVQQLMSQKAQLEGQLAQERSKHLDEYPTVVGLKAQIQDLNSRIQAIGSSVKRSIQLSYKAAAKRESYLKRQVGALQSSAMDEQDRGVQYNVLKRVADTNRSLYDTLLARYNQLNAASGALTNNITIVDRAEVPDRPSSPRLSVNLMIALLLGMALSAVVILLREYFDDAVRAPEDVERKLNLPLLGLVPVSDDISDDLTDQRSPLSEAYHTLVANLMFSTPSGFPKVLMLTSARGSEGKSSSSEAIARDLAGLGKTVLLIDADLRRPRLHTRFGDRNHPGLSSYLVGDVALEGVLQTTGTPNLTCITALPIPPQPSLLLGSPRLGELVARARATFDIVIIDCPPMLGLSDTTSITPLVDGVLMIVDAQGFHRGAVKSALRRLHLTGAPILGVALTKFDMSRADGEYAHYGYNYYTYGDGTAE